MLEGNALAAALDREAGGVEDLRQEGAVELEIELESGDAEDVGENEFDLESRGFDAAGLQECGTALDHLDEAHPRQLSLAGPRRQT